MKIQLVYLSILFSITGFTHAQVGINTESPVATLDVVGAIDNKNTPPGIIAPRLTRAELISISENYTQNQLASIVYVTDLSGSNNRATINVTFPGYYFFDGAIWKSISQASQASNPWYKVGTTLPSSENTDNSYLNAKVVVGGTTIANINGGTNNAQLTVTGGDASINGITVGKGAGSVDTNTALGVSALSKNTTGANNTVIGSNAGIDITTGSNNLVIGSNANVISATNSNQLNIGNTIFGVTGNSSSSLGQVSIGKTAPDAGVALDVKGITQIAGTESFRYVDGKQAENKVLISDASGNASWEEINVLNAPMYPPAYSTGYTGILKKGIDSGISITLPPYSIWVVELGQIVRFSRYLKVYTSSSGNIVAENVWIRLIWSDTPTGNVSGDVLAGKLISGSCYVGGEFHLIAGTSVIQNSSSVAKTYYLTTDNVNEYFIDPSSPITVEGLFQNWGENSLVVIPANNQSLNPEN